MLLMAATASTAQAAHYQVFTSTIPADRISNDGYCSLAEAVQSINNGSAVTNCKDIDSSNPGQITLIEAAGKSYANNHYVIGNTTLTLNRSVRIQPSEEGFVAYIDSSGALAFKVNSGKSVSFYGLNIRHTGTGSGRVIWNAGTLDMASTIIRNGNVTTEPLGKGGGIYNETTGVLSLYSSQVLSNSAKRGGGIYNDDGNIPFLDATISGNVATMAGGGIYNMSTVDVNGHPKANITGSAVSITNNSAKAGGGVFNRGEMHFDATSIGNNSVAGSGSNETCAFNQSCDGFGGGVLNLSFSDRSAAFRMTTNSSISDNKATKLGGGIYNAGTMGLAGTELSRNQALSGAAIYAALFGPNFYCELRSFSGEQSYLVGNKSVPTGQYSIVDGVGTGLSCDLSAIASGNVSPFCKPGIASSCPQ